MRRSIVAATILYSSTVLAVQADSHAASTQEVVMSHLKAIGALDVDAAVSDYAEDASIITPDGVYTGPDEVRAYYETLIEEFSQPDISMETQTLVFEGKTGFLVWTGESPDNVYEYAADTYVVEDGEIVSQTFAAKITPK